MDQKTQYSLITALAICATAMLVVITVPPASAQHSSNELIDVVNALRAERGLPAYQSHPILMQIAQTHAEYLAVIGVSNTHVGSNGLLPFQRALAAGYPVAGDIITNVGWFSENVTGGVGMTAEQAAEAWMGDEPHRLTMLSADLADVGAGVAVVGNTYYYCLDAGLSTGGTPRPFVLPPTYKTAVPAMPTTTPNPDGSIVYVVRTNDTLLGIAIAYNISLADIYTLNGLTDKSIIYPNQEIVVRSAFTSTPTSPTGTPTLKPSSTPWPTTPRTAVSIGTGMTATATEKQAIATAPSGSAVTMIIIAALLAAGILTMAGSKKR